MKLISTRFLLFFLLFNFFNAYSQSELINLNQIGYYPSSNKIALVNSTSAISFDIIDILTNKIEFSGKLTKPMFWKDAGDSLKNADFSKFVKEGTYKIKISGIPDSYEFKISKNVYKNAATASLKMFYYQRCSFELGEKHAGKYARLSGHPDNECLLHSTTGRLGKISSVGGWYDAGDYGKYVINAGITVASLLAFHENFSTYFKDGSTNIPESGNGKSDLLDEVKVELDWLKTMQDKDGGVFFKLTSLSFCGFIMPNADKDSRYIIGKTTSSALDFAAMMAIAARVYKQYDSQYAADCLIRAEQAWVWAKSNPVSYFQNPSDVSTGAYDDTKMDDEFVWAASELLVTTQKEQYKSFLLQNLNALKYVEAPTWDKVQSLAVLSLASHKNGLSKKVDSEIKQSIITFADRQLDQIKLSANRMPTFPYNWGSNSEVGNNGIALLYAYILTKDLKYIKGAAECVDYLLGKNATGYSFLTGFGSKVVKNVHHRPSDADGIDGSLPGFLAGGPNEGRQDKEKYIFLFPAKSYIDEVKSYASNEIAINWNAPVVVLLGAIDIILGKETKKSSK